MVYLVILMMFCVVMNYFFGRVIGVVVVVMDCFVIGYGDLIDIVLRSLLNNFKIDSCFDFIIEICLFIWFGNYCMKI